MSSGNSSTPGVGARWVARHRNYQQETLDRISNVQREETATHPLKPFVTSMSTPAGLASHAGKGTDGKAGKGKTELDMRSKTDATAPMSDPLSMFATELDPLSRPTTSGSEALTSSLSTLTRSISENGENSTDGPSISWLSRRMAILSKYTTSEKLSIVTMLLTADDKKDIEAKTAPTTVADKVRTRLEQLDDFEEGSTQETLNLSQQEYIERIEALSNTLTQAWQQDQRVRSLKIVIQCAKLLADVSVIQFYPSKFVLITDILDTFGRIVFERLLGKTAFTPPLNQTSGASLGASTKERSGSIGACSLPPGFTADKVPESAKETCRNWLFKIASIRELIPRLYVEASILRCYSFLSSGDSVYKSTLERLAAMTCGIGDPLVSMYARCYVCRVGVAVAPSVTSHLLPCFNDFVRIYSQTQSVAVRQVLVAQRLDLPRYLSLYCPALDWILSCIAHYLGTDTVLTEVLERCKTECNSALLLNSIMSAFKANYISARALEFAAMIQNCESTGLSKYVLYRSLGLCVVAVSPPSEQQLQLLNDVWKSVTKITVPSEYIVCAEVWIEFVLKLFGKRELNTLLGDIIRHMSPDRAYEDHYAQLESIVEKVLSHQTDLMELFTLNKFMPFIDMFQKDSVKVSVCKSIMESYCSRQPIKSTNDPIVINSLMFVCRTMHDSVTALSLDDDVRAIGSLINSFISSVSYERDLEQQLSFYVECRATFNNIDPVILFLVHMVNSTSMSAKRIVGSHTRKTAAFVRACAAYSFITIPSLNGVFHKLSLYLGSGQVALINECVCQAEAFFKAAISLIPSVPRYLEFDGKVRSTEPLLVDFVSNFMSQLIVMPDPPDQAPLYLIRGLLNILQDYTWDLNADNKALVFANMLVVLSAMGQEELPYHIAKIDSNDSLYGGDPKFLSELSQLTATLLQQILTIIDSLDSHDTRRRQASVCLDVLQRVIAHTDATHRDTIDIARYLWTTAIRHRQFDLRTADACIKCVESRTKKSDGKGFIELLKYMQQTLPS